MIYIFNKKSNDPEGHPKSPTQNWTEFAIKVVQKGDRTYKLLFVRNDKWETERMNVLKPHLQTTVKTLLGKVVSQREINRKTGVDRKTIRRYGRLLPSKLPEDHSKSPTWEGVATGSGVPFGENSPPRPPAPGESVPKHVRSACEPHREWIEAQLRLGRNGMAIYQDLVCLLGDVGS